MGIHVCEMFGSLEYGAELTYQELLDQEARIQEEFQNILEQHQAEHINFFPLGDTLELHCTLAEFDLLKGRALCKELGKALTRGIDGKFLFVDKNLNRQAQFYATTCEGTCLCKEFALHMPAVKEIFARELAEAAGKKFPPTVPPAPEKLVQQYELKEKNSKNTPKKKKQTQRKKSGKDSPSTS